MQQVSFRWRQRNEGPGVRDVSWDLWERQPVVSNWLPLRLLQYHSQLWAALQLLVLEQKIQPGKPGALMDGSKHTSALRRKNSHAPFFGGEKKCRCQTEKTTSTSSKSCCFAFFLLVRLELLYASLHTSCYSSHLCLSRLISYTVCSSDK